MASDKNYDFDRMEEIVSIKETEKLPCAETRRIVCQKGNMHLRKRKAIVVPIPKSAKDPTLLSQFQFRFRRTDALVRLETTIGNAFIQGRHLAIFFSPEKAYNTTWNRDRILKLHSIGLQGSPAHFHPEVPSASRTLLLKAGKSAGREVSSV